MSEILNDYKIPKLRMISNYNWDCLHQASFFEYVALALISTCIFKLKDVSTFGIGIDTDLQIIET